jgi:hypothetical protein
LPGSAAEYSSACTGHVTGFPRSAGDGNGFVNATIPSLYLPAPLLTTPKLPF